jgi:hypothetical protein
MVIFILCGRWRGREILGDLARGSTDRGERGMGSRAFGVCWPPTGIVAALENSWPCLAAASAVSMENISMISVALLSFFTLFLRTV